MQFTGFCNKANLELPTVCITTSGQFRTQHSEIRIHHYLEEKQMNKFFSFLVITFSFWFTGNTPTLAYVGAGDVAPDFSLVSIDGDTIRLFDFSGKPVLLNFFHYN